ncbi:DMT family transporter [Inhella gelatinilytica]|uniref:DMT family transporter n=1 Tax=Inhella gelatinilytica TaxID=2795030 RepID=A0A931NE73_9BURK|nr:DMT family transporter [Inhella gelatinilytica]MBH9552965.1 DMT family transporter [Inhella gelatinilytica]
MKLRDAVDLLALAAIWGASFLFMRLASPAFGPLTLAFLRVAGAAALLVPILAAQSGLSVWQNKWHLLGVVGLLNSALPFALYAFAALHLPTGLSSILNATVPMWSALVAWLWLGLPPTRGRILGLLLGLLGVVALVAAKTGLSLDASAWAVAACLLATLNYAVGAVATQRWLGTMPSLAVAAGSQLGAALWLLPLGLWAWPHQAPDPVAWAHLGALSLLCTGIAYLFYFRLMGRLGATNTVTVTFLIPVFALVWGAIFLGEVLSPALLAGGGLILVGTSLALGLWPRPSPAQ